MDAIRSSYLELRRDTLLASSSPVVPGAGQVAVYLSVDPDSKVTLSAAALTIDDRAVSHEHFDQRQFAALKRGAADRLYVTGITHQAMRLSLTLAGTHKNGKPWTRSVDVDVAQSAAPRYVEFRLARTSTKGVPDIVSHLSL